MHASILTVNQQIKAILFFEKLPTRQYSCIWLCWCAYRAFLIVMVGIVLLLMIQALWLLLCVSSSFSTTSSWPNNRLPRNPVKDEPPFYSLKSSCKVSDSNNLFNSSAADECRCVANIDIMSCGKKTDRKLVFWQIIIHHFKMNGTGVGAGE